MARKLTQKQRRRIQDNQTTRLEDYRTGNITDQNTHAARVITNYGKTIIAEITNGDLVACKQRQNIEKIVCGDNVLIEYTTPDEAVVVALLPRKSLLQKPGFGGKLKPMAANIDQVVIVTSTQPPPNSYLIDRYLVACENLHADAMLVINKSDLDAEDESTLTQLETDYRTLGYGVYRASITDPDSLHILKKLLIDRTSILVGLSGVGKSSLINELVPDLDIRIGEVSAASGEGTHTTTNSMLYHLKEGGDLIDSPGVRDFGLWNMPASEIFYGFSEFRKHAGHCKFSNCSHRHEPGCAIIEARDNGKISEQRYLHYLKMIDEYSV